MIFFFFFFYLLPLNQSRSNGIFNGTCFGALDESSDVEKSEEVMDKLVVIKFNSALGTSMGFGGPKYENYTLELPLASLCLIYINS